MLRTGFYVMIGEEYFSQSDGAMIPQLVEKVQGDGGVCVGKTTFFRRLALFALALLAFSVFQAMPVKALEVHPGDLSLSFPQEELTTKKAFEIRLRFTPDESKLLDSYRVEIQYDRRVLEFSSGKILSDHFNGKFEMIETDNLLSIIYLAQYDDVMRQPVDMAALRFQTVDSAFSESTELLLKNKLTGAEESFVLTFADGAATAVSAQTASSRASSSKAASSKSASSRGNSAVASSGSASSETSKEAEASSSLLILQGERRSADIIPSWTQSLQTLLLAGLIVLLAAIAAVVIKNRKNPRNSEKKAPGNDEKNL